MPKRPLIILLLVLSLFSAPAAAQNAEVPYWASIRANEVNMRVGPGEDYQIRWVYRRQHMPLRVVRTMEGWRLVEDPDGARGWILARFLSRDRGAYVRGKGLAEMRAEGSAASRVLWRLEPGVVGKLGECRDQWCRLDVNGHVGFVRQDRLWGAGEP
jgi:SH3-like domain-containing protein